MKVTIKGFIHKSEYGGFKFYNCDMSEFGDLLVGPCEFEYEVPADFNPVAAEVAALEKQLDSMANEYHAKVKQIKGRINDLKCIEHTPL